MNIGNRYQCLRVFFLTVLVAVLTFGGFGGSQLSASAQTYKCKSDVDITGDYQCTPKCIIRKGGHLDYYGNLGDEVDIVAKYNSDSETLYKVTIISDNFLEQEIGPRVGSKLWTSTSYVSDGIYPVLEEYLFNCNSSFDSVHGFTKVVRNPSKENFKSCIVDCVKN